MDTDGSTERVPEMITISEASARTGIRYEAIRGMCITGAIVCIRIGRKYLINWDSMMCYLNTGDKQKREMRKGGKA